MPKWVETWTPTIATIVILGGFMWTLTNGVEQRLGARIDRNAELIHENGKAIAEVRENLAGLTGLVRGLGLHKLDLPR